MSLNIEISKISEDQFAFILKNGARASTLLGYEFNSLIYSSFRFVKETLPELLSKGLIEELLLKALSDRNISVFHSDISNIRLAEALAFICWIRDELQVIASLEREHLSGEPDIDLIAAGINELNQFGDLNVIDSLAGGDILKWEQIKELPYHKVFDKQYKTSIEGKIQKRFAEISRSKTKSK